MVQSGGEVSGFTYWVAVQVFFVAVCFAATQTSLAAEESLIVVI